MTYHRYKKDCGYRPTAPMALTQQAMRVCKYCGGGGVIMVEREIIRRQSFDRDVGDIEVIDEPVSCDKCDGSGEREPNDEDDDDGEQQSKR